MNRSIVRTIQTILLVCIAAAGIGAQQAVPAADKYKISAKAGLINYSQGLTSVTRVNGTTDTLISGDQVNAGEKIITSTGGIAEVLLNPGSYLRLGGDSEFSFRTTSLDDLRLEINRGSAILEVFASNEFRVSAFTPKGRVTIVDSGVYRIDVTADGGGLLSVIDGKAVIGEKTVALIKKGNTGTIDGGIVTIGKFDKNRRDPLATWSRTRSKDLAKMASAFNAKNTQPLVIDSLISSFSSGLWGRTRTSGIWIYDPITRQCLFMPFFPGWNSPYGYGNNSCTCYYYQPRNNVFLPEYVKPRVLPARLDGRKEVTIDDGRDRGGLWRDRSGDSKGVELQPSKERVIFSPPPPPPPVVYTKKPIDN